MPEPKIKAKTQTSDYKAWVAKYFPQVATAPMAERHERLWEWFESLEVGKPPPNPRVEIWGRGGAKSSSAELGTARVGAKLSRRFVLYVSESQAQADEHVQSIADLLEAVGVERLKGEFGNAKGWRKNQLRTATGFNVMALGLDTAARGIKLGKFRPDLIILDDIDGSEDTAKTTAKKKRIITKKILPAGSISTAILVIQNLVLEDGLVGQLYDGRADFLQNRDCYLDVAVKGLETKPTVGENGKTYHIITAGTPTWEGQNLEVCQRQINDWGLASFREEAQHEVASATGYYFDQAAFQVVNEVPTLLRLVRAWDYAATQGGGDYTVGVLMGISPNGVVWVLDVVRGQFSSDNADHLIKLVTAWDRSRFGANYVVRTPQDPGSAGKKVADMDRRELGTKTLAVTGRKGVRHKPWARQVNEGNARILIDGRERTPEIDAFLSEKTRGTELDGKTLLWNRDFMSEHRKFREDETHDFDDQVDAAGDAFIEITSEGTWTTNLDFLKTLAKR